MKRSRLNAWFRLFIVVTVLASLGSGLWMLDRTLEGNVRLPNVMLSMCLDEHRKSPDECWAQWREDYADAYRWARNDAIGAVVATAILTPLLLLLIYGTVRWILAGRRKPE